MQALCSMNTLNRLEQLMEKGRYDFECGAKILGEFGAGAPWIPTESTPMWALLERQAELLYFEKKLRRAYVKSDSGSPPEGWTVSAYHIMLSISIISCFTLVRLVGVHERRLECWTDQLFCWSSASSRSTDSCKRSAGEAYSDGQNQIAIRLNRFRCYSYRPK